MIGAIHSITGPDAVRRILADTNEEAANSQAPSTRQSIAVSALALANQSQQSVLQLLR
jgi:flagellin-like hook-associated protein FlgL